MTNSKPVVSFHTRFSYLLSNGIGIVKVLTLLFISLTGLIVLGGNVKRVPEPHANFVNSFEGQATPYGLTNALYKIIFSYAGFENAFNVVNEVKVRLLPSYVKVNRTTILTPLKNRTPSSNSAATASSLWAS
jgi:amino acid transporter